MEDYINLSKNIEELHLYKIKAESLGFLSNNIKYISVSESDIGYLGISSVKIKKLHITGSKAEIIDLQYNSIEEIRIEEIKNKSGIQIYRSQILDALIIKNVNGDNCDLYDYFIIEYKDELFIKKYILLSRTKIKGILDVYNISTIGMRNVYIEEDILIGGRIDSSVVFLGVQISGNLLASESIFGEDFLANRLFVNGNFVINNSFFNGGVFLTQTKIGGYLDAQGAIFEGGFDGDSMQVGSYLFLRNGVRMKGELNLLNASIGGNLELSRSEFQGDIILTNTDVGKMLRADDAQFLGKVIAKNLDISKSFFSSNSYFKKGLYAENASIGGKLYLDESTFKGNVNLRRAKISKYVSAQGVSLLKGFVGDAMHVEGSLFLRNDSVIKGDVNLLNAGIGGNLEFSKSEFQGNIIAENLSVKKLLLANEAKFLGRVDLTSADIGKSFIARGALFEKDLEALGIKVGGYVDFSQQYVRLDKPDEKYDLNPELRSCILNSSCRERVRTFGNTCIKFPKTVFDTYKPAKFHSSIYMGRAEIGMYFDGTGSTFDGILNLEASDIKDGVFLRYGALFKQNVKLMGANIGYVIDVSKSTFRGNISIHAAKIFGHAFFHYGSYKEIDAGYSHLIRNIEFDGSHIDSIMLNYSRVGKNIFARSGAHVNRMIMNGMQSSAVYLYDLHTGYIRLSDSRVRTYKMGCV